MKKIALICLYTVMILSLLIGCSDSTGSGNENLGSAGLGEYKGVKVNTPSVIVTDAEVESRINQVLSQNLSEEELNRSAQEDNVVNIDHVGKQDDVELAGGTNTGYDLTFGSGRFIEGSEGGLIGAKKGDKKELNLTFLETYSEETPAGKPVVFEVTVNAAKEKKDAMLDGTFVQRASDYKTVGEYKESIRADLLKQKQQSAGLQVQQSVLQQVVGSSTSKPSKTALSRCYNTKIKQYEEQAKMYGSSLPHMVRTSGMDVPGLQEVIYAFVKDNTRNQLVINTVAERGGIVLEDANRQALTESNEQDVKDAAVYHDQEVLDEMALNYKVMKFMTDNTSNAAETTETETPAAEIAAGATAAEETTVAK